MDEQMNIEQLVKNKGNAHNVSGKDQAKALKMLKSGKVNMSQLAPKIKEMMMNGVGQQNNCSNSKEDLRARLAARRRASQEARMGKTAKQRIYDKTKERIKKKKEEDEQKKQEAIKAAVKAKKNRKKRLRQLEKKLGKISDEFYHACMKKLNEQEDQLNQDQKRHCQNVIDVYLKQQNFSDTIKNDELDKLLATAESGDEADEDALSDISDE